MAPAQQRFVSGVVESLRQAAEHPGAHAIAWAIYAGETPVGVVMIADEVDGPDYIPQFLWKLLIDERHQGKGYGTATLDLVVEYFRARPGVDEVRTSAGQGEGSPIPFYERYGSFARASSTTTRSCSSSCSPDQAVERRRERHGEQSWLQSLRGGLQQRRGAMLIREGSCALGEVDHRFGMERNLEALALVMCLVGGE